MTPEGKVKEGVRKVLKEAGAYFFFPVQNGMGRVGIPDIVACVPTTITQDMVGQRIGLFTAVETKAPGKYKLSCATPNQQRELKLVSEAHGVAVLADDPMTVRAALQCPVGTSCEVYTRK